MNFVLTRNPDKLILPNVSPQINEQARLQYLTTHTELTLNENQADAGDSESCKHNTVTMMSQLLSMSFAVQILADF